MRKLYMLILLTIVISTISSQVSAQQYWTSRSDVSGITTDKAVARIAYPKQFKLFSLNIEPLRQQLFSIVSGQSKRSTIISLPNADGGVEQFEVFEASNFDPALQARFPEIRAYSGRGITDKYALLKLSISPQGIATMVFRTDKPSEFMEPYSADHTVYAVYKSQREKGKLPWACSTVDQELAKGLNEAVANKSSAGELKVMRLAQSVTAEYSNFFGAFNSSQVGLVLAAINTTLARCNGVYEKDLAVHLNLIPNNDVIIFYVPASDPYSPAAAGAAGAWNSELQNTLNTLIGNANYDIGHLFGASGGGGNAGCIGCVCVDGQKGSGYTSPADGIPQGDNFDIDYVVHEVGHQMGGNHTFTHSNQSGLQPVEVGSGITIMGYAGITSFDVAPHSIDIYHERSIQQIQTNLATKTCPVTTNLAGINATPVVAPLTNYTIPISTPFALTGSATDADPGDALTYCWEENDNSTSNFGSSSPASPTKTNGPNWLSFTHSSSPTRLCPRLSTILAGNFVTGPLPGGDPGVNIEALSSVARTLNFRLTVRDNRPYNSGTGAVGQTSFADMVVTVSNSAGPFQVTVPNTAVSWQMGSTQTVTWSVNNTNAAPINCSNVNILISTDGGTTFSTLLANTPNDGSESITVPNTATTTARIKVEAVGNIFFDISDANFSITIPPSGFTFNTPTAVTATCPAPATMVGSITASYNGGFTNPVSLLVTAFPAGTTVTLGTSTLTTGAPTTSVTLNNTNTLAAGTYNVTIQGTATGAPTQTVTIPFVINPGTGPTITTNPSSQTVCQGANVTFTAAASGSGLTYQWQKSTDGGTTWNNVSGATNTTYTINNVQTSDAGLYRVVVTALCGSSNSTAATLTVNTPPSITTQPTDITLCTGATHTFTAAATGAGVTYQWQSAPTCGGTFTNISGATNATLNVTATTTTSYRVVVTGTCTPSVTSNCATLTVVTAVTVTTNPTSQTVCEGASVTFTTAGSGSGILYQWQISTDGGTNWSNISGATNASYTINPVTFAMNGNRYRALLSNATCTTPGISSAATLTVNTLPSISAQPSNATICVGAGNTFSVTAAGTAITYQWQLSTDGGATYANIAGATASTYAVTNATVGMNGNRYRVVVSGTCTPAATSTGAILTVIAPVTISTQPSNAELCSGSNTSFTVAGTSTQTINYQWQVSTDGGTTWSNVTNSGVYTGATTATLSITGATTAISSNRYRAQLSNATCTSPTNSNAAILTVRQLPSVTLAATLTSLLPGKVSVLTATPTASTGGTLSIGWFFNNNPITNSGNTRNVNIEQVGAYQVRISETWPSSLVCANQSQVVTINASVSDKLFIFPSPNDGRFTVSYYNNGGSSTKRRITIFSSGGAKVYDKTFDITGAYTLLPIDLRNGSRGIYYVLVGDVNGNKLIEDKVHVR